METLLACAINRYGAENLDLTNETLCLAAAKYYIEELKNNIMKIEDDDEIADMGMDIMELNCYIKNSSYFHQNM